MLRSAIKNEAPSKKDINFFNIIFLKSNESISNIEASLDNKRLPPNFKKMIVNGNMKHFAEALNNLELMDESPEKKNSIKTIQAQCMRLGYLEDSFEQYFKSPEIVKVCEKAKAFLKKCDVANTPVSAAVSTMVIPIIATQSNSPLSLKPVTLGDILNLEIANHFNLSEISGLKHWYQKIILLSFRVVQTPFVIASDIVKNVFKSFFYIVRHPTAMFDSVDDRDQRLNGVQKFIKSIAFGFDDFFTRNFYALIHPIDTLVGVVKNLFDLIRVFAIEKNKWNAIKTGVTTLWHNFKSDPIRHATDAVLTLFSISISLYYTVSYIMPKELALPAPQPGLMRLPIPPTPTIVPPYALPLASSSTSSLGTMHEMLTFESTKDDADATKEAIECLIEHMSFDSDDSSQNDVDVIRKEISDLHAQLNGTKYHGMDFYKGHLLSAIELLERVSSDASEQELICISAEKQVLKAELVYYMQKFAKQTAEAAFLYRTVASAEPALLTDFFRERSTRNTPILAGDNLALRV